MEQRSRRDSSDPPTARGAPIAKPPVYRISQTQLTVLALLCLALLPVDRVWAVSALCGGLVAVVPQAWFAAKAFAHRGARSAREVANAGYSGEVVKFLLSAVGFAALFILLRPVSPLAVFGAYIAMLAIQITGSWMLLRRGSEKRA
ncbi:hypothetical protein FV139_08870 [Parahaliea maris]|uniref:ATP synthase protein I n=1 Tax=Parahaliea maris TaxID=2716870 RepID=A0A5C9A179_9GAMM|nr:ATP synthase subunit I [Parahaliea maris]TXS93744.1 hypothetical protein FV139_08870 [Parahaliea maris]